LIISSPPRLRPAQAEVLTYKTGKMGIAAVPGAGKTFIIEQLVVQLIKNGTAPDRIGVGTYMRSAKSSLVQKFANYGRVQVFTLHSLSLQILQEFYPGGFSFSIQEDAQKERLINDLVSAWMELHRSVWQNWASNYKIEEQKIKKQLIDSTKKIIGKAKQACLKPREIKTEPGSLLAIAVSLYDRYEYKLANQQLIDYDDMVVKAVTLLEENESIRSVAQDWFDYLLEDEAQDSSLLQAKMLDILSARSGNLVRVGDPNQAITGTFSNSAPSIFRDFCQQYQRHTLNQSSRSSAKIINLANYLVKLTNEDHTLLNLRSALKLQLIHTAENNPPENLSTIDFVRIDGDRQTELEKIIDRACIAIKERPDQSVAILVLTNEIGNDILDVLNQKGIKNNDLLRNNRNIKKFIHIIACITQFLALPTEIDILLTTISAILPLYDISLSQITLLQNYLYNYFPEDLLYPKESNTVFLPEIPGLEENTKVKVINLMKLLISWLDQSNLPWDELLRLIVQYLQQNPEDLYIGNYVIQQLGRSFSKNKLIHWADISYEVEQILARPLSNQLNEIQSYEPQPGVITVSTIYRSKGLEWDEVFVIDCSNYQFPVLEEDRRKSDFDLERDIVWQWQQIYQPDAEPDFIEFASEKIRLLYVAITRAKKRLTLSVANIWNNNEQRPSLLFDQLEQFHTTQLFSQS